MKRIHLIIFGDVQGVGFRSWVCWQAQELSLTGWVKNKLDNTVEIIAEGKDTSLQKLIDLCHQGPAVARVDRIEVDWQKYIGEFTDFNISF